MAETSVDSEDVEDGQDELTEEVDQDEDESKRHLGETLDGHHLSERPDDQAAKFFDQL